MFSKYVIIFCAVLLFVNTDAYVKRDVSSPPPDPIDAFKKNLDSLKNCLDQSFANTVSDVNIERHLTPVLNIIGDQLNRFSKAFDDLTAPSSSKPSI